MKTYRNKKAKTSDDAWSIQETYEGKPHGWIQWKGTNVCMDVYCLCGAHNHIDADFAYYFECQSCKRVYMCNGHIELIELEVRPDSRCIVTDYDDL